VKNEQRTMRFNFEALPILTKKEKTPDIFLWIFIGCFILLAYILDFYNIELSKYVGVICLPMSIIVGILLFIHTRKIKPNLSDFSIELNDNGITIIDNSNEVFISKSEIDEIIMNFQNIKGGKGGSFGVPSDGKDNTIKIITANTRIEKRIFIPNDTLYHRFYILGFILKKMKFPVKMENFYHTHLHLHSAEAILLSQ